MTIISLTFFSHGSTKSTTASALWRNCQIGGDDVAITFIQGLKQLIAGGGKQVDVEPKRLGFVTRIDRGLERTAELRDDAHLTAAINEEEGLAVRDEKTKLPSLQHRGKVACPSMRSREHEPLAGHALPQRGGDRSNGKCSKAHEKNGNPSAHRPHSDQIGNSGRIVDVYADPLCIFPPRRCYVNVTRAERP